MVDYKEILRLSNIGYSLRQVAVSVRHSHRTVKNIMELAANAKWPCDMKFLRSIKRCLDCLV